MADDDPDDRMLMQEALAENNISNSIFFVENGADLLDYLNKKGKYSNQVCPTPGVIFLDLNMPFIDGVKCLEEIRQNSRMNDIFIVMNTTTASHKEIDLSYDKGANLFLIKPNSFTELKKSIEAILKLDFKKLIQQRQRDRFVFNFSAFNGSFQ